MRNDPDPDPQPGGQQPCQVCDNWTGCQVTDRCGMLKHLEHIKALVKAGATVAAVGQIHEVQAAIRRKMEARAQAAAVPKGPRMFKLQNGPAIPWAVIEPFNVVAQRNHGQNLETLAARGGLSVKEALAVLTGKRWDAYRNLGTDAAIQELALVVANLTDRMKK